MNYSLWLQALKAPVKIKNKKEWDNLDIISKWLILIRFSFILMTVYSSLFVMVLLFKTNTFDLLNWLILFVGLFMAHAINNQFNDFVDYVRGVDKVGYYRVKYATHPLVNGYINKFNFLVYLSFAAIIGFLVGIYFLYINNWSMDVWIMFIVGSLLVLFYTWPIKGLALGPIGIFVAWGPLMISGGHYVISGYFSLLPLLVSIPYGLTVTSVLMGEHIDKRIEDKKKKVYTLPVVIGEKYSRYLTIGLLVIPYIFVFFMVIYRYFSPALLVVVLALPTLIHSVRVYLKEYPKNKEEVKDEQTKQMYPLYFVGISINHNFKFGFLYLFGLIIDAIWEIYY